MKLPFNMAEIFEALLSAALIPTPDPFPVKLEQLSPSERSRHGPGPYYVVIFIWRYFADMH